MKQLIRYSNRKYYSRELSRYVTCEDVADWINAGEDVTALCNKTKRDITPTLLHAVISKRVYDKRRLMSLLKGNSNEKS